jgi:hypothetical protein
MNISTISVFPQNFDYYVCISLAYYIISGGMQVFMIKSLVEIHKKIANQKTIDTFNSKAAQIQRDLHFMKSKSFDTADVNIKLTSSFKKMQDDIDILKHRQYCYTKDLMFYKDKLKKLEQNCAENGQNVEKMMPSI